MTSNQLTLGRLREDTRHNRETEKLGYANLGESKRHNIQSEAIGRGNIGLGYAQLGEAQRHNIASEAYQGNQANAYAKKAETDAAYTELQIQHYVDELKVRQDNAQAALENAATAKQRAEIEQQLADIKADLAYWEKKRIQAQNFRDYATGTGELIDSVNGVMSILEPWN